MIAGRRRAAPCAREGWRGTPTRLVTSSAAAPVPSTPKKISAASPRTHTPCSMNCEPVVAVEPRDVAARSRDRRRPRAPPGPRARSTATRCGVVSSRRPERAHEEREQRAEQRDADQEREDVALERPEPARRPARVPPSRPRPTARRSVVTTTCAKSWWRRTPLSGSPLHERLPRRARRDGDGQRAVGETRDELGRRARIGGVAADRDARDDERLLALVDDRPARRTKPSCVKRAARAGPRPPPFASSRTVPARRSSCARAGPATRTNGNVASTRTTRRKRESALRRS